MDKQVLHRKIIYEIAQSYSYSTETPFTLPLHRHAEYELIYIISGQGLEFVGDSVRRYAAGDLVLIGSNVPHLHLCDSVADTPAKEKNRCAILQFPQTIFPVNRADIQEYSFINLALEQSEYGAKYSTPEKVDTVLKLLKSINRKEGIDRITTLLKILDILGKSSGVTLISPVKYVADTRSESQNEPIHRIYTYLTSNFKKSITLDDIARYAKLNPTALCRCFKRSTGKTVFDCLNEIRIEHACKLLSHSNLTVSQIAYEVGFNNLSHFNKQFKAVTHQTPTEYKERLAMKIGL